MRVRIHRGTQEIGGGCIELANAAGERVVFDVGRPLWAGWGEEVATPAVSGFVDPDPSLLGVVISHPHIDHYGLLAQVRDDVPVFMGREAAALVEAAPYFSPISGRIRAAGHLEHRKPFALGAFRITPFLNDHSAFDAYSLLIEADGRRVFYTGDIRGHGRKAALFEELLANPPADIDTMLMEGTHVRPDPSHDDVDLEREDQLEERFVDLCGATEGAVVVFGSAQNLGSPQRYEPLTPSSWTGSRGGSAVVSTSSSENLGTSLVAMAGSAEPAQARTSCHPTAASRFSSRRPRWAVPTALSSWRPSGRLPRRTTATTTDEPHAISSLWR